MEAILRAFELVGVVLSAVAVLLLGAAAVAHFRRSSDDAPGAVSRRARLTQAFVAATVLLGVISALLVDVPLGYEWVTVAAVALMGLVLWRDERFWAVLAVLLVVFTGVGAMILVALSHNFGEPGGDAFWYGGRQLVAWGGLHANPSAPQWEWTIVALAILRYGLPLALIVTTAWLVSVRGPMTRIERLGLVTASEALVVTVFLGATVSIVVLALGLLFGLPLPLVVLGVIGSVFTLVTVGPGAVAGILVAGRTLVSRVPTAATGAATLVSSLDTAGTGVESDAGLADPSPVWRSFSRFVTGDLSPIKRWNLRLLVGLGALVVIGMFTGAGLARVDDAQPVHFEYISEQIGVDFEVAEASRGSDDDVWLLGDDGEIAMFDLGGGELVHTGLRASGIAVVDGQVHAITEETPARVVSLDPESPDEPTEVVTLADGAAGKLAVNARGVYIAGPAGEITRFGRDGGELQATVTDTPALLVVADGDTVWTVHPGDGELTRPYRIVPRDPQSLEPRGDPTGVDPLGVLSREVEVDDRIWLFVAGRLTHLAADDPPRFLEAADPDAIWEVQGVGELYRRGPDDERRFDFHYDTINGVFETPAETWLLVDDDQGTIIDSTEVTESYLVLWKGWTTES